MNRKFRFVGWLVVAGLLGAALLVPSSAMATDVGQETATASAPVETGEPSSKVETSEPSQDVETSEPSQDVETQEPSQDTETSEPSQDVETSTPTITPCADCVPSTHSVPSGSVDGATGTPDEGVTPPATDTLTPSNTTASNDGWQLVLIALAALISTALILTPATRKARR